MNLKDRMARVQSSATVANDSVHEGLRSYMLKVYNFMASGVLLTGFVSLLLFKLSGGDNIQVSQLGITGTTALGDLIFKSGFAWV